MPEGNDLNHLNRLAKYWQKKLRPLRGWRLTVQYASNLFTVDGEDGSVTELYGKVDHDASTHTAKIFIRPEADILPDMDFYPEEETLVHELLHLIWLLDEETAINMVAETLVGMRPKRGKKK